MKVGRSISLRLRASIVPFVYKARRALGQRPAMLEEAATRQWIVAPGHEEQAIPIYVAEGHLRKIIQGVNGESPAEMAALLRPKKHVADATVAYLLEDVVLAGANLYSGMYKHDLFSHRGWGGGDEGYRAGAIECGVLAADYGTSRWFGHFIHDELPLQMLTSTLGSPVMHRRKEHVHEAGWREALSMPAVPAYDALAARKVIVLQDYAQNRSKRERCKALREKLAGRPKDAERIYLRRDPRSGMERVLVNEEAVIKRLVYEGFTIVEPGVISVEELLRKCFGARMVVSVEGSHMSTVSLFARDGGRMLGLHPPYRVTAIQPQVMWSFGIRGGIFVCDPAEGSTRRFRADPNEVMRAIDAFEATDRCEAETVMASTSLAAR